MLTEKKIRHLSMIASEYVNKKKIVEIKEITSGNINDTYVVVMPNYQYILQKINTNVFKSPFGMMNNIKNITEYIKSKVIYEGDNPQRYLLNIVKTKYGEIMCIKYGEYWRMLEYISNSKSYEVIPNKDLFYEVGRAVGSFQNLLKGFPPHLLDETIKHFHDTPYRYKTFLKVLKNKNKRIEYCDDEIDFIISHKDLYSYITNKLRTKEIPIRVTHNDTKPSNILFDINTDKALCLIDLDTVMKGSILYDYGDALRIGASVAKEDEEKLELVDINLNYIESFTYAFLKELKGTITKEEVHGLYYGYLIMTLELSMRFLTDYFNYDKYFKINYEEHNLIRSRNQIEVVKKIEENKDKIINRINKCLIELDYKDEYLI